MFNPFVLRKWTAVLLAGMLPTLTTMVLSMIYGLLWYGIIGFLLSLIVSVIIASLLLKNPFSDMLEGKGILCLNIDSTGILRPFIVRVNPPYITGKIGNTQVNDVFDRAAISHLAAPKKAEKAAETITEGEKRGGIKIELSEKDYNSGRFALFHWPVLLYNEQIKSIITKDWLAEKEKDAFAEHGVLYLNRKMEELTSLVRDFGRYIVELLKPRESLMGKWWVWLIIAAVVGFLVIMFAPAVLQAVQNMGGGAVSSATSVMQQAPNAVNPV